MWGAPPWFLVVGATGGTQSSGGDCGGCGVCGGCGMKPVRRKPVRRCWTEEAAAITLQALCRGHLVCIFVEQVRAARARAVAARAEAVAAEAAAVAAEQELAEFEREEREC